MPFKEEALGFNSIIVNTLGPDAFQVFADRDEELPSYESRTTDLIPQLQMSLSKLAYDIQDEKSQERLLSLAKSQHPSLRAAGKEIRSGIINLSYLRMLNLSSRGTGFEYITDPQYRHMSRNRGYVNSLPFPEADYMLELYRIRLARPSRLLFEMANGHIDHANEITGCKNCKPKGTKGVKDASSHTHRVTPYLIHLFDCTSFAQSTRHHHEVKEAIASLLKQAGLAVRTETLPSIIYGSSSSPPAAGDLELKAMDIVVEQVTSDTIALLAPQATLTDTESGRHILFVDNTKQNPISRFVNQGTHTLLDDETLTSFFTHAHNEKKKTYGPLIQRCGELGGGEPTLITATFTSCGRPSDACYHMISKLAGRLAKGRTDRMFQMGATDKITTRSQIEERSKNRIISDFFMKLQKSWLDHLFKTACYHQHIDSRKDKPLYEYRDYQVDPVDAGNPRM